MSDPAIRVTGLGKQYRIGVARQKYATLRESIAAAVARPFKRGSSALGRPTSAACGQYEGVDKARDEVTGVPPTSDLRPPSSLARRSLSAEAGDLIWALKDVSFDIQPGEVVGVIGRNGAGKSTLLKILTQITYPTEGRVDICGRVGSLLEVGTGFHPELTGRENIFLNGAILGMKRAEIVKKFDEIVAFAEIDKFIDTPVKRYSSGMYVRLAFAVAAHLEPEILLVDEVLAVGDIQFQKKCLGKMGDISKTGRTILFVSHNMGAIAALCSRAILLESGLINRNVGSVEDAIRRYLGMHDDATTVTRWENPGSDHRSEYLQPQAMFLTHTDGRPVTTPVRNDEEIYLHLLIRVFRADPAFSLGCCIYNEDQQIVYISYCTDGSPESWPKVGEGDVHLVVRLPPRLLNEGEYRIEICGGIHYVKWLFRPGGGHPHVCLRIHGGLSESPYWVKKRDGVVAPVLEWKTEEGGGK